MKQLLSLLVFLFPFSLFAQGNLLLPVKLNGRWGFINEHAEIVIQPVYNYAVDFVGAYAVVKKGNASGIIDRSGKEIIAPAWEAIQVLNDTLMGVKNDSLWSVIDYRGKQVLPPTSEFLKVAFGKRVLYKVKNKIGLLDANGNKLIPPLYDSIYEHGAGYFITLLNGKSGVYSLTGSELLPTENEDFITYYDNLILFKKESRWGCVNKEGEKLIEPEWSELEILTSNFINVRRGKFWECYSLFSRSMSAGHFNSITWLGNNLLMVEREGNLGIMNEKMEITLPMQYLDLVLINPTLYRVAKENKFGLVSASTGKLLMPAIADEIKGFYNMNVFAYSVNEKWGLVNAEGNRIVKPEFAGIELNPCVARAYQVKGGPVTMINFDISGNLLGSEEYAELHVIKVEKGPPSGQNPLPSTLRMDKFQWFFVASLKKWGLRKIENDSVVIPPTFKTVRVIPSMNITIVEVKSNPHSFCIDQQCFYSNSFFGLVSNSSGKCITAPCFFAMRLTDLDNAGVGNSIVGIKEGGMALIDPHTGKASKICSFIDKFSNGQARIIKGGSLSLVSQKDDQTLCTLSELLNSFNVRWQDLDGRPFWSSSLSKYVKGGKAKWGYMKPDREQHLCDKSLDYLDNFKGTFAVFKSGKFWGACDTVFHEVITPVYDKVELVDPALGFFKLKKGNKRYGYIGKEGNTVVDVKYSKLRSWSENRFLVKADNRKWGFTDETGKMVIEALYDDAGTFSEGLAAVKKNNKWGYIDREGRFVIEPAFEGAGIFSEGKAAVKTKGRYGYIDRKGKKIIASQFTQALPYYDGIAIALKASKYGLINESGQWVKKPFCKKIGRDPETGNYIIKKRRKQVLVNGEGKVLARYKYINAFNGQVAVVKKRNKFGYIDARGKLIIPAKYSYASSFENGLAKVKAKNLYGYIDESGETIILDTFMRCGNYNGTSAFVWENGKAGLIDRSGKWLVQPKFTVISEFSEGKAVIQYENEKQQYFIDVNGNVLFAKNYQKAKPFKEGMAWVMNNGKWQLMDANGLTLSIFQYDQVGNFEKGVAQVSANAFYGLSMPGNNFLLDANCEDIQLVQKGLYRVTIGDKIGYFTSEKEWLWEARR